MKTKVQGSGKHNRKLTKEERIAEVRKQRLILAAVLAAVLLYLCGSVYYLLHFLPNTTANGVEVSGMSGGEARAALQEAADHYSLTVEGPAGNETISDAGLALKIADASGIGRSMRRQHVLLWPFAGFFPKNRDVPLVMEYNRDVLEEELDGLSMLREENMEEPVDAQLSESEDGSYAIVAEKEGTELAVKKAREEIRQAVEGGLPTVSLEECRILPGVRSDDPALTARAQEWNRFLRSAGLTFTVTDTAETFDKKMIASLLTDDGEHVTLSRAKVEDLMAEWHEEYDTYGTSFEFKNYYGKTVSIEPYGDYGWYMDQDGTADLVMEKIEAGDTGTYGAKYFYEPPTTENRGLGGNYVEVNIDEQHLWVWKDGEVVVDTDVVTGLPVHGSITYHGCYSIKSKDRDVTLGELDVQGYESPVEYWLPFNGGEGIHDAPWREEYFGGKIWIENGSHGCVNVPSWAMGDIFSNVEVGEAVVVYGRPYDEGVNDVNHKTVDENYYYDVYYGSGE